MVLVSLRGLVGHVPKTLRAYMAGDVVSQGDFLTFSPSSLSFLLLSDEHAIGDTPPWCYLSTLCFLLAKLELRLGDSILYSIHPISILSDARHSVRKKESSYCTEYAIGYADLGMI